jgi:hypothetical protein
MQGKNKAQVIVALLLILAVTLVGGSCHRARVLTSLTDAEWEKALQIALETPEVKMQIENNIPYKTQRGWVGIVWKFSHAAELWGIDYGTPESNIPPEVPGSAVIYPQISLLFGEPERLLIRVAVDLAAQKAVHIEQYPLKPLPSGTSTQ